MQIEVSPDLPYDVTNANLPSREGMLQSATKTESTRLAASVIQIMNDIMPKNILQNK